MDGILDTIESTAAGWYNSAAGATADQLKALVDRANGLRAAGQEMTQKIQRLQSYESTAVKNPALYEKYKAHLSRGASIRDTVSAALQKADNIIASVRASGFNLGAVPFVAAGALLTAMAAVGAAYYAINAWNRETDAYLRTFESARTAGANPEQLTRMALNLPGGAGAKQGGNVTLIVGGIAVVGLLIWMAKR